MIKTPISEHLLRMVEDKATRDCNRVAVFLIGRTGSGKTSVAKDAEEIAPDRVRSVFPGARCREVLGSQHFAEHEETSVAPSSSEGIVRQVIADALSLEDRRIVIVDGFPRSKHQVEWIFRMSEDCKIVPVFVYVSCSENVRKDRLHERDQSQQDKALTARREIDEPVALFPVFEALLHHGYDLKMIDNTTYESRYAHALWAEFGPDSFSHVAPHTLDFLFREHLDLNDFVLRGKHGMTTEIVASFARGDSCPSFSPAGVWLRRYAAAMRDEAEELLAELPSSWWSDDKIDLRKVRVEIVDVLHFLLSAAMVAGLDARSFHDLYRQKREINMQRQRNGYKKREKREHDDDHLGSIPGPPSRLMRVYLAGPILGTIGHQEWKDDIEKDPRFECLDPLKRRLADVGPLPGCMDERIEKDLADIASCDALIAYLPSLSSGTAMEIFFADRIARVPVHVFAPASMSRSLSGWITEHAESVDLIPEGESAGEYIVRRMASLRLFDHARAEGAIG